MDYAEFCKLMRMEKRLFAEDAFAKFSTGAVSIDDTIRIFKEVWIRSMSSYIVFHLIGQSKEEKPVSVRSPLMDKQTDYRVTVWAFLCF